MLADKHTRNARLLSDPSDHAARGDPDQDGLVRTPLWLTMMKAFPSGNGRWDPKQADRNDSGRLAQSPQQPKFHLISTYDSSELTLPPFVEPSQTNEPPIPGPSPSSEPHEDILTSRPTPPHSIIIIDDMPVGSPPPSTPTLEIPPISPENPTASSPHSHDETCQEFTDLQPTLMIPSHRP
ncbi:hypothetical protein O181_046458 [Austropuccinia psidii MF-1]|uniref:Uncharacterized protein n=1 Tax=Austropuccinia psidii MF-1 TaxID=1389203 RepID=A0A9Q3DU42_9BASI|nr:hypothetical protein [Austropuccinia psidii MF-1]